MCPVPCLTPRPQLCVCGGGQVLGFPQGLKTPHSPSSSLLSPSLGHLPTKPAATTATAGPLAPGLCGDRKQPPRAGGSKGNKKAPIPLCTSCLYMGVTYLVAGGVSLPPLPVWVCCLLQGWCCWRKHLLLWPGCSGFPPQAFGGGSGSLAPAVFSPVPLQRPFGGEEVRNVPGHGLSSSGYDSEGQSLARAHGVL